MKNGYYHTDDINKIIDDLLRICDLEFDTLMDADKLDIEKVKKRSTERTVLKKLKLIFEIENKGENE